jgi:hypothetical protein
MNDYKGLKDLKVTTKNLTWREQDFMTDLYDWTTPLADADFLGRLKIAELLIENAQVDLDLCTEEHEYTPLSVACMAGNYEIA